MKNFNWDKATIEERKEQMFKNRLYRLNKLVELNAPKQIIFNESILVAKSLLDGDNISTESLIKKLKKI